MVENMIYIKEAKELLIWMQMSEQKIQLSLKDAEVLLGYMEGHDFAIGVKGHELYRVDVAEENGQAVSYTMDELIDCVCEWNYELMEDAEYGMHHPKDFVDYANYKATFDKLKEDEDLLNKMFGQTIYGQKVVEVVQKAIYEVLGTKLVPYEEKPKLPPLPDNVIAEPDRGRPR